MSHGEFTLRGRAESLHRAALLLTPVLRPPRTSGNELATMYSDTPIVDYSVSHLSRKSARGADRTGPGIDTKAVQTYSTSVVEDDRDVAQGQKLRLFLLGTFAILAPNGANLTPKGQKAKALLALVAASERGSRSRTWLCDKLWSDRQAEQALASLRQTLTEIRRSLGIWADDLLQIGRYEIRLNPGQARVDVMCLRDEGEGREAQEILARHAGNVCFLEGIDVRDPEFEEWLSAERCYWDRLQLTRMTERRRDEPIPPGISTLRPIATRPSPQLRAFAVAILPPDCRAQHATAEHAATIAIDLVSQQIHELAAIEVLDLRALPASNMQPQAAPQYRYGLQVRVSAVEGQFHLAFALVDAVNHRLEWTASVALPPDPMRFGGDVDLLNAINHVTDKLIHLFGARLSEDDDRPDALVLAAVDSVFEAGPERLVRAERQLRRAFALTGKPQTAAWLAFALSVAHELAPPGANPVRREEVASLVRHALDENADNPLTLTLCAHAVSEILGDHVRAGDLYVDALRINSKRALTWGLFARLHAHLDMPEAGLKCGLWATQVGGPGMLSPLFDAACCLNATLAGQHDVAIAFGRKALANRPHYRSVTEAMARSREALAAATQG